MVDTISSLGLAPQADRILVVDDHRDFGEFVQRVAEKIGFHVTVAQSADAFRTAYPAVNPAIICLDIVMPQEDGIELITWLAQQRSRAAIYIITGHDPQFARAAVEIGRIRGLNIAGVLQKPVSLSTLRDILAATRDDPATIAAD
jgi:DNA-binding response OmpR family regulator